MKYVNSGSPQIRDNATTKRIMIDVCIALLPACIVGLVLLGLTKTSYALGALLILAISVLSAVASEIVFRLCAKVPFKQILAEFDFTSVVTGLLIGMNMYHNSKWYAAMLASVFAVVVVKMLFGGTGQNIVNPAIAGRIFAFISFGSLFGGTQSEQADLLITTKGYVRADSTPLQLVFENKTQSLSTLDLFLGTGVTGCIGEVSKAALIIGAIYLIIRGVLDFKWPLLYIVTTGVVTVIAKLIGGMHILLAIGTFLPSILGGGLFLGAIFMATDYVTTPITKLGKYVYFVFLGVLTAVLREVTKIETVSFVILLGNLIVPLIDNYFVRRPFGYHKATKEAK